jgi:hypothetical protein
MDIDVGFVDPYIIFKDPVTPPPYWKPQAEKNLMRFLVNQRNKTMILFPYNFE